MADFDVLSTELLEESKRFLEKAGESVDTVGKSAYLHAALMVAFCALEAGVNSIADVQNTESDTRPPIAV
jgi:hypothetical protein